MNATEAVIQAARDLDEYPGAWRDNSDEKMAELMFELRRALDGYRAHELAGS